MSILDTVSSVYNVGQIFGLWGGSKTPTPEQNWVRNQFYRQQTDQLSERQHVKRSFHFAEQRNPKYAQANEEEIKAGAQRQHRRQTLSGEEFL